MIVEFPAAFDEGFEGLDAVLDELSCRSEKDKNVAPSAPEPGLGSALSDSVAPPPLRLQLGGIAFLADPSGALFEQATRTLIVADLHFEKASRYAMRGQMLPPYDTAETLSRLEAVIARLAPRRVICLGDSFHDCGGPARLTAADAARIDALCRRAAFVWIAGNHDPDLPANLPGERAQTLALGEVMLRHTPFPGASAPEICGHLHPAARIMTRRGSLRRRCFAGDGRRLVLPAFGALAGGLNILDQAFAGLFATPLPSAYLIGRSQVFPVLPRHLQAD